MNSGGHWGLLGRVLGLLAITAALAACGGSAKSGGLGWQERLSGKPHIFAVDYVQPNQLAAGQGAESVVARYPLVITGETYATPNPMTTYLNSVRSLNSNIVLMSYLNPFRDDMPEST